MAQLGGRLLAVEGDPQTLIPQLARRHDCGQVFANEDYEPTAVRRDAKVAAALADDGRELVPSKDKVLLHRDDVLSQTNTPYTRFAPYYNAWLRRLGADDRVLDDHDPAPLKAHFDPIVKGASNIPLARLGFDPVDLEGLSLYPGASGACRVMDEFVGKIGGRKNSRGCRVPVSFLSRCAKGLFLDQAVAENRSDIDTIWHIVNFRV